MELINIDSCKSVLKVKNIQISGICTSKFYNPEEVVMVKCGYLATCNCFTRKEILYKIGGFDPLYFIIGEDTEVGFKINQLGHINVSDSRTAVLHNVNLSSKRDLKIRERNRIRFVLKNFAPWKILLLPVSLSIALCIEAIKFFVL